MRKQIRIDISTGDGTYATTLEWLKVDEKTDEHNKMIEREIYRLNKKHPNGYKISGIQLSEG